MTDSKENLNHATPARDGLGGAPGRALSVPPARSYTTPPPDPAEALYYEGMAAYQHRNWEEALARFGRLKEFQPTRPGLDALLDEVRWFLQLQATAPAPAINGESAPIGNNTGTGAVRPRWQTWLILIPALIGVAALLLIALQGRLPWSNTAERSAQELYNRGQARLTVGDYEGAYAAFKKLLEISPNDPEAQLGMKRAERQQTLAQGYAAAEAAIAEENWDKAAAELEKVLALDSSYAGTQAKADFVSQRRRLANLYNDGSRLYDLGQWQEALNQFQKIRELDSSYRAEAVNEFLFTSYLNAGQGLINNAAGAVTPIQHAVEYYASALAIKPRNRQAADARRLGGTYLEAVRALNDGNASDAQARLETLLAEDPIYGGGQAAQQLYTLLLKQAEKAVQGGDITAALRFYQIAQGVPVADHNAAMQGAAQARLITPTPTPQPTATPRPTPLPVTPTTYVVVRGDTINIRGGPGLAYPVLGQARAADRLTVTGRDTNTVWLRICTGADAAACPADQMGWVAANQVDGSDGAAAPIITPPPVPTTASLPAPASPTGQVVCIAGQIRDTRGGAALSGWTITLQGPGATSRTQRTGNDGAYQLTGLTAGVYTVRETLESNWRAVSPLETTVTVAPGPVCITVDFWNERSEGGGRSVEPTPPR